MSSKCLKCGYLRTPEDDGPDYACPRCGGVYAKVESASVQRRKGNHPTSRHRAGGSSIVTIIVVISTLLILVHGALLMNYGTMLPCDAAAMRIITDARENKLGPMTRAEKAGLSESWVTQKLELPIAKFSINQESALGCYEIALGFRDI